MSRCERCLGKFLLFLQLICWTGLNSSLWFAELPYMNNIIYVVVCYALGTASFLLTIKALIKLSFKTIAKSKIESESADGKDEWEFCNVCDGYIYLCNSQYDHHCYLLDNCVGHGNYVTFLSFLINGSFNLCLNFITKSVYTYVEYNKYGINIFFYDIVAAIIGCLAFCCIIMFAAI